MGGVLACAYHGLQFDATGQCVAVPTEGGDCPLARRLRVRSYPTEERAGLIFGYIGDVERFPPPPLRLAAELEDPAWSGFICEATWQASWLRILDNLTDPMHGPYLHGHSYTLSRGLKARFDWLDHREVAGADHSALVDPLAPAWTSVRDAIAG